MSQRATHLEQSTHTDLHYGLVPVAAGNSATLEPKITPRDISANEMSLTEINAASDKITQNAATRADSSLSSQIDAPEQSRSAARKASRWRYTDGIAPQLKAKVVTQPQFAVHETPVRGSFRHWLYRTWLASLGWLTSFLVHLIMLPVLVLLSVPAVQRVWLPAFEATQGERIEVLEVAPPMHMAELPSTVEFRIARPMTMEVSLPDPKFERGTMPSLLSAHPLTTSRTIAGPVSEIQQLFGKGGSGQSESGQGAGGA
ncbi:MAG TPA: hypothetical protein VL096_09910, partial [Pirellulaceae bacterium]|nr:hypothetical protein [Pirellulaceae bacterium]